MSVASDPARPDGLRLAVKPHPRGLASWTPHKETWPLLEQVRSVLRSGGNAMTDQRPAHVQAEGGT
jgi:hypothetical protein